MTGVQTCALPISAATNRPRKKVESIMFPPTAGSLDEAVGFCYQPVTGCRAYSARRAKAGRGGLGRGGKHFGSALDALNGGARKQDREPGGI